MIPGNGGQVPTPLRTPTATLIARAVAHLVVVGAAGWAFASWQDSAAAGLAFALGLWVLGPMRAR